MKYLVGNLKMNLLFPDDVRQYLSVFAREMEGKSFRNVECIVCPPLISFGIASEMLPQGIYLGGQNAFFEKEGSYTGETSPEMLKRFGAEYVILGHSERRSYFGETDEMIRKKIDAAGKSLLRSIFCVGETKEEREADETAVVIERMIRSGFEGLSKLQAEKIIIAYEPRWAIGNDTTPTTDEIFEMRILIRKILSELFDPKTADRIPVLYGGSVKSTILNDVCLAAGMDGALVGRESLSPHEMVKMGEMFEVFEQKQKEEEKE